MLLRVDGSAGVRSRPSAPRRSVHAVARGPHDTPTTARLFGPVAIAAHTVMFTPAVGAVLATINHRRLGNGERARRTALAFVLPGAVLLVAEFVTTGSPVAALPSSW